MNKHIHEGSIYGALKFVPKKVIAIIKMPLFHDNILNVHYPNGEVSTLTIDPIENIPVYIEPKDENEKKESYQDIIYFLPITEMEFKKYRKKPNDKKWSLFKKKRHEYYGFIMGYKFTISPMLRILGKRSDKDVYEAEVVFEAKRFTYTIDGGEVYITAIKDQLYPSLYKTMQGKCEEVLSELIESIDYMILEHCRLYIEGGDI